MTNPQRNRKRVRALRRAPDGSAFQKCDECRSSVPVALMDMHECQGTKDVKKDVKRIMGKCEPPVVKQMSPSDEPRSAFQFFLECYMKTRNDEDLVEVNREAFDKWKKMSDKEQWPYIQQAEKVERAYMKVIREEVNQMSQMKLSSSAALSGMEGENFARFTRTLTPVTVDNSFAPDMEGDDEADSATVGKFAQFYEDEDDYEDSENSDNYNSYWPEQCENRRAWKKRRLW